MTFVLLDDKFHSHAKTAEVGNAGAGLFTRALSYCGDHLTDGFVPRGWAHEIGKRPLCRKLVDAGFWIEVEPGAGPFVYVAGNDTYTVQITKPGYFIPDYLISNPSRQTVLARRDDLSKKRSDAGKKGAQARWQRVRQADGKGDGKSVATDRQSDGPLPLPLKERETRAVPPTRDAQPSDIANVIDISLGGAA